MAAIEIPIYVYAVTTLPIADAMTYYLATPIYVTAISAFLGEKVGWRRWCAVLVGFAGVVIALRPSEAALSSAALIALSGSMLYAVILTLTGTLRGTADGVLLIGQHAGVVIICGIITAMKASMPTPHDTALMILIGVLTLLGSLSVNRSLKIARPSVVVPYQYSLLLWGAVFGYVFFDEALKLTTVIGAILIIVAGFYIFLREQKRAKPQLPLEPG
ncbi:MAG: DMT family transporter [Pseudorhodoplanes sp.]